MEVGIKVLAALLVIFVVTISACSGDPGLPPGDETGDADFPEGTLDPSDAGPTTAPELEEPEFTSEDTSGILGQSPVLRLEGAPEAEFSGICTVGEEEYVISGQTPSSYDDFGAQSFSCRIEKQDSGEGSLKVIVALGNTTRSVQQTSTEGSVISTSYEAS